jgi:hypothetical protein
LQRVARHLQSLGSVICSRWYLGRISAGKAALCTWEV